MLARHVLFLWVDVRGLRLTWTHSEALHMDSPWGSASPTPLPCTSLMISSHIVNDLGSSMFWCVTSSQLGYLGVPAGLVCLCSGHGFAGEWPVTLYHAWPAQLKDCREMVSLPETISLGWTGLLALPQYSLLLPESPRASGLSALARHQRNMDSLPGPRSN